MTDARARLESVVDALRRKQLLAITVTAFVEAALAAACLYAIFQLGLPNLQLSKGSRALVMVGVVLILGSALLLEQARQGRSVLFLAKRIDDENQLDDHLVSALSFADPTTVPFERACVNSLILRLQSAQLRIPGVRLERLWLLIPALLITAGTGFVDYQRRLRPTDDGSIKISLPSELRDRVQRLDQVAAEAGRIDPKLAEQTAQARQMLDKLLEHSDSKENVLRDISSARDALHDYDAQSSGLIDAALQLGDPTSQRAQQLVNAMRSGKPAAVNEALHTLADALSGKQPPPLSDDERAEIASILGSLAQAARASAMSAQLNEAAKAVREAPTGPQAGRSVEALAQPLSEALSREGARKQLESQIRSVLADAAHQADLAGRKAGLAGATAGIGGGEHGDGGAGAVTNGGQPGERTGNPEDEDVRGGVDEAGGTPRAGASAGTATEPDVTGGTPESATTGVDSRISSPWVGAPVRQLVAAGAASNGTAQTATRLILAAQQKQLEREVRREEIPAEYAQSIRRYFANVQTALEQTWKPSK